MPTTGQLIRQARVAAGISQNQLARKLGVTGFLVSHWENDRRPVTDLDSLATALKVLPVSLVGDPRPPKRKAAPLCHETPNAEPKNLNYISISEAGKVAQEILGKGTPVTGAVIHGWVNTCGLPAYRNLLRKNRSGDPTLLFIRDEFIAWIQEHITPVVVFTRVPRRNEATPAQQAISINSAVPPASKQTGTAPLTPGL